MFDLTPSDEQRMMQDLLQKYAREEISPLAAAADVACVPPDGFLENAYALGMALMQVPTDMGGGGGERDTLANTLNLEALAQGDFALALAATTNLSAINLLLGWGNQQQRDQWLTSLGNGELTASVALQEPKALFEPLRPELAASRDGDHWVLNGTKTMVPLGALSDVLLVFAALDQGGVGCFVMSVEAVDNAESLKREPDNGMGLRGAALARIEFNNTRLDGDALLGGEPIDMTRVLAHSHTGLCALAAGQCQSVLDYVVPYSNERNAFGEPISNRQSIAFMLADMATELESMRLLAWRSADALRRDEDQAERCAYQAHIFACEWSMRIGNDGVQVLGGHGFTREHPVELWYRHLRALPALCGQAIV